MFADDINLFLSHDSSNDLVEIIHQKLDNVPTWLKINKLSLNMNKTNFILFHTSKKKMT